MLTSSDRGHFTNELFSSFFKTLLCHSSMLKRRIFYICVPSGTVIELTFPSFHFPFSPHFRLLLLHPPPNPNPNRWRRRRQAEAGRGRQRLGCHIKGQLGSLSFSPFHIMTCYLHLSRECVFWDRHWAKHEFIARQWIHYKVWWNAWLKRRAVMHLSHSFSSVSLSYIPFNDSHTLYLRCHAYSLLPWQGVTVPCTIEHHQLQTCEK